MTGNTLENSHDITETLPLADHILQGLNDAFGHYRNKRGYKILSGDAATYDSSDTHLRMRVTNPGANQPGISFILQGDETLSAVILRTSHPNVPLEANNSLVLQFQTRGKAPEDNFMNPFHGTKEQIAEQLKQATLQDPKCEEIWNTIAQAIARCWHV